MCQSTGYKLKSNKELPSTNQKFGYVIPKTNNQITANGTFEDKPNVNQLISIYTEVDFVNNDNNITANVYMRRIDNITKTKENNKESLFSQLDYSTKPCQYEYLVYNSSDMYGKWVSDMRPLVTVSL